MRDNSNATGAGWVTGGLGVLAFSFSLPATRLAVEDLNPWLVSFGRAVGAALLATAYLAVTGSAWPTPAQWRRLAVVALGVVVGFPTATSLALTVATASRGAVVVAALPAVTAVFAVLRAGERPPLPFWIASGLGLVTVLVFILVSGSASGRIGPADLLLLLAIGLCGLGYAE